MEFSASSAGWMFQHIDGTTKFVYDPNVLGQTAADLLSNAANGRR